MLISNRIPFVQLLLKSGEFNQKFARILTVMALKNTQKSLTSCVHYLLPRSHDCGPVPSNPGIQCIMGFLYIFCCTVAHKVVGLTSIPVSERKNFADTVALLCSMEGRLLSYT